MPTDNPRPTRAAMVASFGVLAYVWVFLIAVVIQNTQAVLPSSTTQPPAYTSHLLSVFVIENNDVVTVEDGVTTMHVRLMDCPKTFKMTSSEGAPIVELVKNAVSTQAAYAILVDRPFAVVSSRTGLEIIFEDGQRVSLQAQCDNSDTEQHYAAVFVQDDMVYLADMTSGTAAPLFYLQAACQLVWNSAGRDQRAFVWEMSTSLSGINGTFSESSRIAFTFTTERSAQLNMTSADKVSIVSASGVVTLYSDCGTPVMMPRPRS